MFYRKWSPEYLSGHYLANVASTRLPIVLMLPTRRGGCVPFCIDSRPSTDPAGAWSVEVVGPLIVGRRPDITVSPSINAHETYHGHLTHGVLSPDLGA